MPLKQNDDAAMSRRFLRDHIYGQLRAAIVSGELVPGERLRVEELVEHFGGSRFPVRDALSRLASDGLVVVKPQSGSTVALIDVTEYEQSLPVLSALFTAVIREATPLLTDKDRHALSLYRTEVLADSDAGVEAVTSGRAVNDLYDIFFHRYGNEVMTRRRDELVPSVMRVFNIIAGDVASTLDTEQQQLRILIDQANAGNSDAAADAMRAYLENTGAAALQAIAARPELSETARTEARN